MARRMDAGCDPALRGRSRPPYHRSAGLYDALLGRDMLPLFIRNFGFLVRRYRARFRSVADAGCGTGGFVRHLCRWGVPVFGVDVSPAMVAVARRRNRDNHSVFLVQDMRRLRLPYPVDLITCNFDALNYLLTAADLQRAFRCFHRNLAPGGHLFFDMIADTGHGWRCRRRILRLRAPGLTSVWTVTVDPRRRLRRVVMRHVVTAQDGTRRAEREVHVQRAYPAAGILDLLGRCGFVVLGTHHAGSLRPPGPRDARIVYVARKRPGRVPPS